MCLSRWAAGVFERSFFPVGCSAPGSLTLMLLHMHGTTDMGELYRDVQLDGR